MYCSFSKLLNKLIRENVRYVGLIQISFCNELLLTIDDKYQNKSSPPVIDNDRPQLPSVKSHLKRFSHIHLCIEK